MITATHRHLRFTQSDLMYVHPIRFMPELDWHEYKRMMLIEEGFDLTRPISVWHGIVDVIYSQERDDA